MGSYFTAYGQLDGPRTPYFAEGTRVVGLNKGYFNNRPLYGSKAGTFVLAGDKPLIRLVSSPYLCGTFMAGFARDGKSKLLIDFKKSKSSYSGNRIEWILEDPAFPNLVLTLAVVPMDSLTGCAIRLSVNQAQASDKLFWAYGGISYKSKKNRGKEVDRNLAWELDIMGYPELSKWNFSAEECKNNSIEIEEKRLFIRSTVGGKSSDVFVAGQFPKESEVLVKEADVIRDFTTWDDLTEAKVPLAVGEIDLKKEALDFYWAFEVLTNPTGIPSEVSARALWDTSCRNATRITEQVAVATPDHHLNALAPLSNTVISSLFKDSVYLHGAMLWNEPYPGWRTVYGGIMYGWHERVLQQAHYYLPYQIQQSDKTRPAADETKLLTKQSNQSRLYGVGYIARNQDIHNFQPLFFDQLISAWRATGDTALQRILSPALTLHLQWQTECFDPDGDGLYESYVNTWPTDSQWYNGGGTAEETSFAYRGHLAARDMARQRNDQPAVDFHNAVLDKIRTSFFRNLWLPSKGHSGSYKEQGGYQRVHVDPWLYSIFLPVDVGLVDSVQAISSLYYTKYALQNDPMPLGGRQVWTSNWVPGIWSIRERYPGDNYHLALAYFQAGLGDEGYEVFKGTYLETAYNGAVPGNLGAGSGTDFGDCAHMFVRTLVEGLFGYRPDYPNGVVKIAPTFPVAWDSAAIQVPDYALDYKRSDRESRYYISLKKAATLSLFLPADFEHITAVFVNDKKVDWQLRPGIGRSMIHVKSEITTTAKIVIVGKGKRVYHQEEKIHKKVGEKLRLKIKQGEIVSVADAEQILQHVTYKKNVLEARVGQNTGNHSLSVYVKNGQHPQLRIYRLKITDPEGEQKEHDKSLKEVPLNASWDCINIKNDLNADVRTIYQQKYLSPRPNTVSVRIGTDGYSPWTFLYWGSKAPAIKLDSANLQATGKNTTLLTKQGVPFQWMGLEKNIAFASLWDNWPNDVTFSVNKKGKAAYFLVCGSTNPMQCAIANAVIYLNYADGSRDSLSLVPPHNYWNLSPITSLARAPGQMARSDYLAEVDAFCVPRPLPETVQLGQNCRAMLLNRRLKKGVELQSVELKALSQEVVVGLMGITILQTD
nr:DUF4450 domain-containing protein [Rhabdobacter roseus]